MLSFNVAIDVLRWYRETFALGLTSDKIYLDQLRVLNRLRLGSVLRLAPEYFGRQGPLSFLGTHPTRSALGGLDSEKVLRMVECRLSPWFKVVAHLADARRCGHLRQHRIRIVEACPDLGVMKTRRLRLRPLLFY